MATPTNLCPFCKSRKITLRREVGCFFVIFLFVSMGLGLLMYPFLPKEGSCKQCGAKWKV